MEVVDERADGLHGDVIVQQHEEETRSLPSDTMLDEHLDTPGCQFVDVDIYQLCHVLDKLLRLLRNRRTHAGERGGWKCRRVVMRHDV